MGALYPTRRGRLTGPVLVVAAHADDEVLGCGGTMARWAKEGRTVHVLILADGVSSRTESGAGQVTARTVAAAEAGAILGAVYVETLNLADNRLDHLDLLDIVQIIEKRIDKLKPTTVLTHHAGDVNVDHRVVHQAVLAACRPQPGHSVRELLYFEVPSSTEWSAPSTFAPTLFVDIMQTIDQKRSALLAYNDEMRPFPHPRSYIAVEALARWRGATAGFRAAEAFMVGRILVA